MSSIPKSFEDELYSLKCIGARDYEVSKISPLSLKTFLSGRYSKASIIRISHRNMYQPIDNDENSSQKKPPVFDVDDIESGSVISIEAYKYSTDRKPFICLYLSKVDIILKNSNEIEVQAKDGSFKHTFEFSSPEVLSEFSLFCKKATQRLIRVASKSILRKHGDVENGGISLLALKPVFLIEIVSVSGMAKRDCRVDIFAQGSKIHSTDPVKQDLDPVFTVESSAFFLYQFNLEDYYHAELLAEVKTMDGAKKVGSTMIPLSKLFGGNGERVELSLVETNGKLSDRVLSMRGRRATKSDKEFMRSKDAITNRKENFESVITPYRLKKPKIFQRRQKIIDNVQHFLALPEDEEKGEQWFTEEQLKSLIDAQSTNWTNIYNNTGTLGKLFIEILSCDDLEAYSLLHNPRKGNPFVTIVLEDSIATTDAVPDCRNPRFAPWSKRAFKMNIEHSSSPLYIGVHDWNPNANSAHIPYGRTQAIHLDSFHSGIVYSLVYNLHTSGHTADRKTKGKIRIRLQVQWNDEREAFFDSLVPPKSDTTVFVDDKKDLAHSHFTVHGDVDFRKYNIDRIYDSMDELYSYHHYFHTARASIKSILFWKSTHKLSLCGKQVGIPMRSIVALLAANILVELPQYTLTAIFGFLGWLMLGLLALRRETPSPWKPPTYHHLLKFVMSGKTENREISSNENIEQYSSFVEEKRRVIQEREEITDRYFKEQEEEAKRQEVLDKEWNAGLYVEKEGFKLDPTLLVKDTFYPLQLFLVDLTAVLRFVHRILTWDHTAMAFTLTSSFFLLSIVCALLQYFGVWVWIFRILVWIILGPWNYFLSFIDNMSEEEYDIFRAKVSKRARERFNTYTKWKTSREEKIKALAMKRYFFGTFGLQIPESFFRPERYEAEPLLESSATFSKNENINDIVAKNRNTTNIMSQGNGINGENMIPNTYLDFKKNDKTFYRSISMHHDEIDVYRLEQEVDSDDDSIPSERTPLNKKM